MAFFHIFNKNKFFLGSEKSIRQADDSLSWKLAEFLHHNKTIIWDFFALLFKNGTLGEKEKKIKVMHKVLFIFLS